MGYWNLVKSDAYCDLESVRSKDKQLDKELDEFVNQLEKEKDMDESYKDFILCLLTKEVRFMPSKRKGEKDDIDEHDDDYNHEENDPQYDLFLRNLEKHGKSYVFKHKKNGSCDFIKYEGDIESYDDSDPEPQRIRGRRSSNQKPGLPKNYVLENQYEHGLQSRLREESKKKISRKLSDATSRENAKALKCSTNQILPFLDDITLCKNIQIGGGELYSYGSHALVNEKHVDKNKQKKEDDNIIQKQRKLTAKGENVDAMTCSSDLMLPDSDYLIFIQNTKNVGNHQVLSCGGHTIVYEKDDIEIGPEKGDNDDDDSDVKILDIGPDWEDENLSLIVPSTKNLTFIEEVSSKVHTDFRQQLMCIIRKPYDREEYKKLRQDVEVRKAVVQHRDLRNGREMSYSTSKAGKSYLDSYPDFEEVLLRFNDDQPKCLNLLRGFFFWLQSFQQKGSFRPWRDPECLAVRPGS
ncbi:Uncharacterized protein Adt_19250 [Abeliophyllum distichum]|uniref:Uncharacterized protein n=1 Tax=Abeliophyllum distichum TaxID=126358 RepID=A0ABD1SSE8_9LAMI